VTLVLFGDVVVLSNYGIVYQYSSFANRSRSSVRVVTKEKAGSLFLFGVCVPTHSLVVTALACLP